MAIVSRNGRTVLFIHVPKNGGTSVTNMLRGFGDPRFDMPMQMYGRGLRPRHLHGEALEKIFAPAMVDYAFMVVRSPVERMVSEYRYQARKGGFRWQRALGFDRWLSFCLARAQANPWFRENHFRPQVEFECFDCSVFKIEDGMARVAQALADATGLDVPPTVEQLNATKRGSVESLSVRMSKQSFQRICERYQSDMELYRYSSDPADYARYLR
ncbi:MAG: sulfotransferase family 2 domain-containing protein [Pseudomonadota bacterium]